MNDADHKDLDRLINACLDGQLTEDEAARLSALIEESSEVRHRYWELASVHGFLEQSLQEASLNAVTGQGSTIGQLPRILSWKNPFTTAAAGLLLGAFCASIVWASSFPSFKSPVEGWTTLLFESFESNAMKPIPRVPNQAGRWYGDFSPGVSLAGIGKNASNESFVARFHPNPKRRYSYARYLVDLANLEVLEQGEIPLELEVVASFSSSIAEVPAYYQIRLVAFEQEPARVPRIWNNEAVLFNTALQHVGRNEMVTSPDRNWRELRATLDIPPGSRSLLISLGAGDDTSDIEHFLDGVQVRLKVEPANEVSQERQVP